MPGKIKIKVISLMGVILLGLGLLSQPVMAETGFQLSVDTDTAAAGIQSDLQVSKGDKFDVDVYLQLPSDYDCSGVQFALSFSSKILKCKAVEMPADALFPPDSMITGPSMPDLPSIESGIYNDIGYVDIIGIASFSGVKGSGVIARYSFEVIANGQADISIATSNLKDSTGSVDITASVYDLDGYNSVKAPELVISDAVITAGSASGATDSQPGTSQPGTDSQAEKDSSFPTGIVIGVVAGVVVVGVVIAIVVRKGKRS
ncbi:MAG: cohesin domain-containing protein [Dehalococcoidales bacterium]|jgi:hypothetical protein